jgi:hypothetical protein
MPVVNIKGVGKAKFPDDMKINDIRTFLRQKYSPELSRQDALTPRAPTIQSSNPSLATRAATAIGEGLNSAGIISDRFGAQQIGKNVTSIGEFLPGIGDAAAGDEFGRALKQGNFGDAAIAGAGAIPLIGDMAIFAGVLAKTANLGELAKAQKLESGGAGRDEVWKETGWVNDKGDWKFEISDSDYELNEKASNVYDALRGSDAPKSYPESRDVSFSSTDMPFEYGGVYSKADGVEINLNRSNAERKTTALHESQHMVQDLEGFEIGGNASPAFVNGMQEEIKSKLSAVGNDILSITKSTKYQERINELLSTKGVRRRAATKQADEEFGVARMAELESVLNEATSNPVKAYRLLAGEAEARNVETRMDFTPQQRRDNPPWSSLDVPESTLIYKNKATK